MRYIFYIIGLALMLTSCKQKAVIDDPDEYLRDSLKMVRVKDSIHTQEETYKDFISSDLRSFQLKGRVKQLIIFGGGFPDGTINFDREGNLIPRHDWQVYRNDNGWLNQISEKNRSDYIGRIKNFVYNVDGTLRREKISDNVYTTHHYLKHNKAGWPIAGKTVIVDIKGEEKFTISYPKIDRKGNWTMSVQKRTGYEYRTRRRIVYW